LSKAENGSLNEEKDSLDKQFVNKDTVWSSQEKGDLLIQVTAWAGLTVNHAQTRFYGKSPNNFNQKYNVIIDTTIVWPMNHFFLCPKGDLLIQV
jgi:hypothetical protein